MSKKVTKFNNSLERIKLLVRQQTQKSPEKVSFEITLKNRYGVQATDVTRKTIPKVWGCKGENPCLECRKHLAIWDQQEKFPIRLQFVFGRNLKTNKLTNIIRCFIMSYSEVL